MTTTRTQNAWHAAAAFSVVALAGCGKDVHPSATGVDRDTRIVLNALAECYSTYMQTHRGRPPQDEAAFRKFLQTQQTTLELYEIESVDALLKSPRDGEPFQVLYGKTIPVGDSGGDQYVAFEQTGIDEFRMAVRSRGGVDLLNRDDFNAQIGSRL